MPAKGIEGLRDWQVTAQRRYGVTTIQLYDIKALRR